MTIISDTLKNVAKTPATTTAVWFSASLRQATSGGIIVDKWHKAVPNSSGVFTTPDLDPGRAIVRFAGSLDGDLEIIIPSSGTPLPLWPLISAAVNVPPDTPVERLMTAVGDYFEANPIETGGITKEEADQSYAPVSRAAKNPDEIAVGAITRSANGAATGFAVVWDDGATGVFVGTESTTTPGAIDSYTVTHVLGGVTTTYTQSALTRDANGAVTARPAMTVS
ncbi:hypothetical protein CH296_00320 [Rhodococcus sp. 14-2496-1d]|uniref:hypothetical protein n=1 Tax=Rhodococcus sp. 14-2496-1d TaxID=2023146 RepID=UPI000B9AB82B|nr:hypothetical protein [Rhodococcus sp. 14-2496-1d]OZF40736.1 hypothetical protein CH296_00320 [Rhodococcus sp. 14-2496-1d]